MAKTWTEDELHDKRYTRGDVILYSSTGKWYEQLITRATHGPYVHCAIVVDAGRVVAARTQGIGYEAIPADDRTTTICLAGRALPAAIEQGVLWAEAQVGKEYGWIDIAAQAVKFLWPANPFQMVQKGHYDCSDFCTRYLQQCGIALPDQYANSYANTPNDLARWAGLLPARARAGPAS